MNSKSPVTRKLVAIGLVSTLGLSMAGLSSAAAPAADYPLDYTGFTQSGAYIDFHMAGGGDNTAAAIPWGWARVAGKVAGRFFAVLNVATAAYDLYKAFAGQFATVDGAYDMLQAYDGDVDLVFDGKSTTLSQYAPGTMKNGAPPPDAQPLHVLVLDPPGTVAPPAADPAGAVDPAASMQSISAPEAVPVTP